MTHRKTLLTSAAILLFTSSTLAQVSTGTGTVGANSPTTNPRLGIGTTDPDYPIHIVCDDYNGTAEGLNTAFPNNGILVQKNNGTSGTSLYLEYLPGTGRRWGMTSTGPNNAAGTGNFAISDMNAGLDRLVIKGGTGEIGIGTLNPSAQLHTTSTVRFQGLTSSASLTDVLVRDANGNLFYRNASSVFAGGSGWQLTGNAIGGTEFIGTTNNNDLRFRTNNSQKMVLTAAGRLGIGTATPNNATEIFFADHPSVGNNGLLLSNSGTHASTLYLANTNTGGRRWALASTGSSNAGGAGNLAIADITGGSNAAVIEGGSGNFGINVDNPDAQLHVDGTVRFENLPTGEGSALVIDANGNVMIAESSSAKNARYEQEIKDLKAQVTMLMKELTERLPSAAKPLGYLEQNNPNPFSSNTVIRFYLSQTSSGAYLRITDLNGRIVKNQQVTGYGLQTVTIPANELGNGTYIYSLVVGNQLLDSKKMVLIR